MYGDARLNFLDSPDVFERFQLNMCPWPLRAFLKRVEYLDFKEVVQYG